MQNSIAHICILVLTGRPILVYVEIYILVDRNEYLFGPFTNYIIRKSWGEKLTSTKKQGKDC